MPVDIKKELEMFDIFLLVQIMGIIILAGAIVFVITRKKTMEQSLLLAIGVAVLVNLLGYLAEMTSKSEEAALMAVKMSYLGKCFICWLMLYFILIYYKCRYPKRLMFFMLGVHMFIYICIYTCQCHSLYYIDVRFIEESNGFAHLELKHGFIYYLHMFIAYIYECFILFLSMRHFIRNKGTVEGKIALITFIVALLPLFASISEITNIFQPYDIMNLAILLGTFTFAYYVLKYRLYETVDIGKDTIVDRLSEMMFITNSNFEILYSNNIVKEKIADNIFNTNKIQREFIKKLISLDGRQYELDGRFYDVNVEEMKRFKNVNGYIIMLNDITDHIKHSNNLEVMVSQKTNQIERMKQNTITNFANIIELRDDITGMHVKRTSEYVRMLATALKERGIYSDIITDEYIEKLANAAPLHDVGKITISDVILKKDGALDAAEFENIKQHTVEGRKLIEQVLRDETDEEYLEMAKNMAYCHHEKWDGTGYPEGRHGEEIPLCARIMAVADVFDALTSKRSYKDALSVEEAFDIMLDSRGSHFEAILVDVFVDIEKDVRKICA